MANQEMETLTVPVIVNGVRTNVTFDIKDAYSRQQLSLLGALAYKDSATGSFTPEGTVEVTHASDTEVTVNSITAVGTLPNCSVENGLISFDAGTLPTKGTDQTVIGAVGNITALFVGTSGSVTVS